MRPLLVLVTAVLAWLLAPGAALAQDPVTWGVRPATSADHGEARPNYAYTAAPGETIRDAVAVTNHGDRPITLLVYAADGFTTASGQLDLVPGGEKSTGVGAWTRLAEARVDVPAKATAEIPFAITVPADAEPGDHSGGVVTSLAVPENADGVTVDRRLGTRIHLRVLGEAKPALAVRDLTVDYRGTLFGPGSATVSFRVENTGNLRVSGEQTVSLQGLFGLDAHDQSLTVPELLPGASHEFTVPVADVAPLFRLKSSVRLTPRVEGASTDAQPAEVTATATTWAVPWSVLGLLVLVAAAVVVLRWWLRRRRAATERRIARAVEEALGRD
ncbi:DUF916 domain-containing protein [Actinosynnema sp. NPDC020468]|uniref:WxL protein peptidoglycan domain-containing protein n=1 Tax=Actinosynnema sp. NPDC020468 TaxID=3154488 RepID=UPI0034085D82